MKTISFRFFSVAILVSTLSAVYTPTAIATTWYVAPLSSHCTPEFRGTGTLTNPWVNLFDALRQSNLQPGDTLILRGGVYRNSYDGFQSDCGITADPGINTLLPLTRSGTAIMPIVIENYPGEIVILDGTDADMLATTWTPCGTNSFRNVNFNVGSARTPQIWVNPSGGGDPGTRLVWDEGTSCTNMQPGTFRVPDPFTLLMRLPDSSDANRADIHMSCQNGDCAAYPIFAVAGAAWITVKRHAAGGKFYVKYGYYNAFVSGGAHDIVFDGVEFVSAGGRDYGQCVRIADGSHITVQNGSCRDVMGEGIAFYGGGPGGVQDGEGANISDNTLRNMDVFDTGRAFIDLGGTGDNLGMGVIIKNCSNCSVTGNRIRNTVGPAIQVTTSRTTGTQSVGVFIDRNDLYNFGHRCPRPCAYARTFTAINIEPQNDGRDGAVHDVWVTNNSIHNETFTPNQNEAPKGIVVSDSGFAPISGVIIANNSFRHVQGVCIDLYGTVGVAVVRNNAMALCNQTGANPIAYFANNTGAHVHDHNAYWAPSDGDTVVFQGGDIIRSAVIDSWEDSAVTGDPLFVSAANLALLPGSPLIDAGTNASCPAVDHDGARRPAGARCDIGAFEFGSVAARTPATPASLRIIRK